MNGTNAQRFAGGCYWLGHVGKIATFQRNIHVFSPKKVCSGEGVCPHPPPVTTANGYSKILSGDQFAVFHSRLIDSLFK